MKFKRPIIDANARILRSLISVGSFLIAAKVIGLLKEIYISYTFGVSSNVDVFLFSLFLTQFAVSIVGSAICGTYVPVLALHGSKIKDKVEQLSCVFGQTIICGVIIAAFSMAFLPYVVSSSSFDFSAEEVVRLKLFIFLFSSVVPVSIISRFLAACLMARENHSSTFLECMPSLGIIIGLIISTNWFMLGFGYVLGVFCECICLSCIFYRVNDQFLIPKFSFPKKNDLVLVKTFLMIVLSQFCFSGVGIVDQFVSATFPVGTLSTIGYATKVLTLPVGLATTTIGRSILPVFGALSKSNINQKYGVLRFWSLVVGGCGVILSLLLICFSGLLVKTLFERGEFTPEDTVNVGAVLCYASTFIPFYLMSIVVQYGITGLRKSNILIVFGLLLLISKVGFTALLVPFLGWKGIMLSSTAAYALLSGVGWYYFSVSRSSISN